MNVTSVEFGGGRGWQGGINNTLAVDGNLADTQSNQMWGPAYLMLYMMCHN